MDGANAVDSIVVRRVKVVRLLGASGTNFAREGGYDDLTKEILRHFEAYGFLNPVIIQCDKEMSIIDVCRKVARERNARKV